MARTKKRIFKFIIPPETKLEYKNIPLLQKFVSDRGKILSRRFTGVGAKEQRLLCAAIRRARYLGLVSVGGARNRPTGPRIDRSFTQPANV